MDPNSALGALRVLAEEEPTADVARQMQEYWQALDDWLTSAGFLPTAWAVTTYDVDEATR